MAWRGHEVDGALLGDLNVTSVMGALDGAGVEHGIDGGRDEMGIERHWSPSELRAHVLEGHHGARGFGY